MNEKQPFEKRISDKLQRLPLPDSESSWQQMKSLLDDKMPRAGGFKPYGRWWWTGMIAVFFTAVIWLLDEQYKSAENPSIVKTEKSSSQPGNESGKEDVGNKKNLSAPLSPVEKSVKSNQGISTQEESINPATLKSINDNTSTLNTEENQKNEKLAATLVHAKKVEKNSTSVDDNDNNFNKSDTKNSNGAAGNKKENNLKNNEKSIPADKNGRVGNGVLATPLSYSAANKNKGNDVQVLSEQGNDVSKASSKNTLSKANQSGSENGRSDVVIETSSPAILQNGEQHNTAYRNPEPILEENESLINTDAALTPAITNSSSGSVRMSSSVLKKASITAAIINDKSRSKSTREAFSLSKLFKSVSLPYEGENWWAAGLSLNTGVATGSQNRVNYNINAKQGAALDYLPSPYLQYHVNSNLYLQTEFNFSAPQYTAQLLVAQKTREIPSTNDKFLQSTYVQKLYYFNLPLSVYYSPVKNLFFNAGLQFSSLQSGLKQVEERKIIGATASPTDPVYTSEVLKFKDDTIAARLTPNEWRWETGANYYISRFTLGVKYNNSFSDLVKVQPAPGVPVTSTRNSTFLVFLRYNLWESRKKESNSNFTSSLFK